MESKYHSFEDLWIWQEAMEICYEVYECMKDCHDYGLRNQMYDSSVSAPSNIAEGFELHTDRAFIRHLSIAKGSSGELRTQVYVAIRRKYISQEKGEALVIRLKRLSAGIQNFITARKLKSRRRSTKI
jgi:four helix bundle protein